MENKDCYSPKEVAGFSVIVSDFAIAKSRFYRSGGTGEATSHAKYLLDELLKYKQLPENVRSEIGVNISKIEAECLHFCEE